MNARWWRETAKLLSKYALTVYLPTLLIFGCNGLVLPVLPAYARKEFGADDATNGLVMSMLNLAGFLMDLPGGILMGVIPPQVSSVISGAFLVASGLLGGFATDLGALGAARASLPEKVVEELGTEFVRRLEPYLGLFCIFCPHHPYHHHNRQHP